MSDLDSRLAEWNPVRAEDVADSANSAEAARLLRLVVSQPITMTLRRRSSRSRNPVRAWSTGVAPLAVAAVALGVAAAAIAVAVTWPGQPHGTTSRSTADLHLVDFSVRHGTITARITDPDAAASQLTAVFRAHGLDIQVQTVPVSPSLVGTIVYSDAPIIRTLWSPACSLTGCPVGLVIPASFTGRADIAVGRLAKPGEGYQATADVFAPGEALHCSGLLGAPAASALPVLRRLHLTANWWALTDANWPLTGSQAGSSIGQRPERARAGYIVEGDAASATQVALDTLPRLPHNRQFQELESEWNRGCQ